MHQMADVKLIFKLSSCLYVIRAFYFSNSEVITIPIGWYLKLVFNWLNIKIRYTVITTAALNKDCGYILPKVNRYMSHFS